MYLPPSFTSSSYFLHSFFLSSPPTRLLLFVRFVLVAHALKVVVFTVDWKGQKHLAPYCTIDSDIRDIRDIRDVYVFTQG
jgi:hypothetical protein